MVVTYSLGTAPRTPAVARLILEAWNPRDNSDKLDIEFVDGDHTNVALSNLRWKEKGAKSLLAICTDKSVPPEPMNFAEAQANFEKAFRAVKNAIKKSTLMKWNGKDWLLTRVTEEKKAPKVDYSRGFVVIPQSDEYELSDRGIVRNRVTHQIVEPSDRDSTGGHWWHSLKLSGSKKKGYERVCDLVAQLFLKPDPSKPLIRHKDGNLANNCVSNLERYAE